MKMSGYIRAVCEKPCGAQVPQQTAAVAVTK